jgi:hypothetical protein
LRLLLVEGEVEVEVQSQKQMQARVLIQSLWELT